MLVDVGIELGRDDGAVPGCLTLRDAGGVDDARELDLHLDGPVLVEIPEEPVLVVADGGDAGHHQTPGATHLGLADAPVGVFPQDAVILLVHAHGVGNGERLPAARVHYRVEVVDLAQAVTPQSQGVGE